MNSLYAPPLKECDNATYSHRVDDPANYNFCIVPHTGYDALLFAGIALISACVLQGKFSALNVYIAGGLYQALAFPVNLGRFGNAISLWLGLEPADIFLYVFLPPMLLDAAVRIEFFIFKKMLVHVVTFSFLIVGASVAISTPVLLYLFGLKDAGWVWQHAALFASMIASTDAVAVSAILKSGGGPERMVVLMEGESLFNDATSLVLFEIFFEAVKDISKGHEPTHGGVLEHLGAIVVQIAWLAAGGAVIGYAFGVVTRLLLKFLHRRTGHAAPPQLALTLGMAYLCFYLANGPAEVSGVIAVVVFGLHGSATAVWGMSAKVVESGAFDNFWDTMSFVVNGIVFFYAGASSVNFFWRTSDEIYKSVGSWGALYQAFRLLPLLYLTMLVVRGTCILIFNPLFRLAGAEMSIQEVIFTTMGGLRGAVSLILAQMVVTEQNPRSENQRVTAELAQWTAGIVVLTLLINAPLMPLLLKWTGLADVSPVKARMRAKAERALLRYTSTAIRELQQDEDEMLRGVDWAEVRRLTDLSNKLDRFTGEGKEDAPPPAPPSGRGNPLRRTAEWVAEQAHWFTAGRRDADVAQPLLADQDEEIGMSRPLQGVYEDPEAVAAGEDALASGNADSLPIAARAALSAQLARQLAQLRGGSGQLIQHGEGQRELDRRMRSYGTDEVPFGTISLQDRVQPPGGQDTIHEVPVEDEEHPGFDMREPEDVEAARDASAVDKEAFGEVPPPQPCDSPPVPAGKQGSRPADQANGVEGCGTPMVTPFAMVSQADYAARTGPSAGQASSVETVSTPTSRATADKLWAAERERGTPAEASGGERAFATVPNPILQPPLLVPGESGDVPAAMPHMHWVRVDMFGGRASGGPGLDTQPRPPHFINYTTQGSIMPTPSLRSTSFSKRKPKSTSSKRRQAGARVLARAVSGSWSRMQEELEQVDMEEEDNLENNLPEAEADAVRNDEVVVEARVRLVAGLKRYFHAKRGEGLLSAEGMQLLDHACDLAMDRADQPLNIWSIVRQEACGKLHVQLLSRLQFLLRHYLIVSRTSNVFVRMLIRRPASIISDVMGQALSQVMLRALEVSVELWLALSWSPQAQWLNDAAQHGMLGDEVKDQRARVWKFILDREIEAPARFQAIQTYRASCAILHQQVSFVEQLYGSGMVDEAEKESLLKPIEKAERRLTRKGVVSYNPKLTERLRSLPFLAGLSTRVFDSILARGSLLKFAADEIISSTEGRVVYGPGKASREGMWLVLAGLVKCYYKTADNHTQEVYLGSGSAFGVLSALVGEDLPGQMECRAVGNALGQGPVVFHLPQQLVERIASKALAGDAELAQLRLDLYRVAALFVVERLKSEVAAAAVVHYQHTAVQRARHSALRRLAHSPVKTGGPNVGAAEAWRKVCARQGARDMLRPLMKKALAATCAISDDEDDDDGLTASPGPPATPAPSRPEFGGLTIGERPIITDDQILSSVDAASVFRAIRKHSTQAITHLKAALRDAELVVLRPGQRFEQRSTAVLLTGTLRATGWTATPPPKAPAGPPNASGDAQAAGKGPGAAGSAPQGHKHKHFEVEVQFNGPTVLPWLWEDEVRGDGELLRRPAPIPLFCASPTGAQVMVCPPGWTDSGEEEVGSTDAGDGAASCTASIRPSQRLQRQGSHGSGHQGPHHAGGATHAGVPASASRSFAGARPRRLPTTHLNETEEDVGLVRGRMHALNKSMRVVSFHERR